jgi:hypothetical protein
MQFEIPNADNLADGIPPNIPSSYLIEFASPVGESAENVLSFGSAASILCGIGITQLTVSTNSVSNCIGTNADSDKLLCSD